VPVAAPRPVGRLTRPRATRLKTGGADPEQHGVTQPRAWIHRVDDPFDGVDRVCYESDTTWALLPVSLALSFFYLAFAVLHHSALAPLPGAVMDGIAVVSSLVAVGVAFAAWRHRIPDHLSHAP